MTDSPHKTTWFSSTSARNQTSSTHNHMVLIIFINQPNICKNSKMKLGPPKMKLGPAQDILEIFGTIWNNLGPFKIIWYHLVPFGIIQNYLLPCRTIWHQLEPFGAVWGHLGLFKTISDYFGPFGIVWYHFKPFLTILEHFKPFWTI